MGHKTGLLFCGSPFLILLEWCLVSAVKESRRSSWTDTSRSVASASQCISDQLGNTFLPPPVSGSIEQVLPSPGRSSRFQAADDSPGSNASYSLLTSPSSICRGHVPQHPGYVHAYNYGGDMSLGMEKVSRSKVLPNEVWKILPIKSDALQCCIVPCVKWFTWVVHVTSVSILLCGYLIFGHLGFGNTWMYWTSSGTLHRSPLSPLCVLLQEQYQSWSWLLNFPSPVILHAVKP